MTTNLTELFEVQRKLDAEIEKKHPTAPGEDRLAKRILALLVELGECANEWRGFKFWSVKNKPVIRASNPIEHGNPMLEEYVDCLHFILSIGLDTGLSNRKLLLKPFREKTVELQFIETMDYIMQFHYSPNKGEYQDLLSAFIALGKMLGFTWEQVTDAYMSKNKTNWERQANGY